MAGPRFALARDGRRHAHDGTAGLGHEAGLATGAEQKASHGRVRDRQGRPARDDGGRTAPRGGTAHGGVVDLQERTGVLRVRRADRDRHGCGPARSETVVGGHCRCDGFAMCPQSEYTNFAIAGSLTFALSMTVKPVPTVVGIDWPWMTA